MYTPRPKDIVAVVLIISIVVLKLYGINGSLDTVFALIVGYYFGHRRSKVDHGH